MSAVPDSHQIADAHTWALRVRNLGKRFDIYRSDRGRLLEFFGTKKYHREFWALRNVSLDIPRGSAFGVIGPNGAGKSTLLRLLSGVSRPTEGEIERFDGSTGLLDLSLGFHEDFTGIENIYLACSLLGMSEDEIDEKVPYIIEFAEIEDFIDYPVRTYSSGMSLRLGFAIAAHVNHDLFLIDEVLAVGDEYFQRKCVKKIEEFLSDGKTLLLVSHDLHAIRSLCSNAIWLHGGRVVASGPAKELVDDYVDVSREREGRHSRRRQFAGAMSDAALARAKARHEASRGKVELIPTAGIRGPAGEDQAGEVAELPTVLDYRCTSGSPMLRRRLIQSCHMPEAEDFYAQEEDLSAVDERDEHEEVIIQGSGEIKILSVRTLNETGEEVAELESFQALTIAVTVRTLVPVERPILGVAIFLNDGTYIFGPNIRFDGVHRLDGTYDGVYTFFLHYPCLTLLGGTYRLSVAAYDKLHLRPHVWHNQLYELKIRTSKEDHGLVHMDHHWGLITHFSGADEELPP